MAGTLKCTVIVVFWAAVLSMSVPSTIAGGASGLSTNFYQFSCPNLIPIVQNTINYYVSVNRSLAPALLRMHFHDCFVRGCDGSVLIDGPTSEKTAIPNAGSLRGFEVIAAIKAQLELPAPNGCPRTVSCADTVALAALYSTIAVGGPFWNLPLGRRDGNVSNAAEANAQLPSPFSNETVVAAAFAAKGLSATQMAILSGSHTIGSANCGTFSNRLYNFTGNGDQDPTLDPTYAAYLKTKCSPTDRVTRVAMKPGFPFDNYSNGTFDSNYYNNLKANRGLFTSDQSLLTNPTTLAVVNQEAATLNFPFFNDFAAAMIAMGEIGVLTGTQGAIHVNCSSATG